MNPRRSFLALCALSLTLTSHATEDFRGNWTIAKADDAGFVRFGLMHRMNGGHSSHESEWPVSAFQGLQPGIKGKRDVQFSIARNAGRFDCEGYLRDDEGAGLFRFTANPRYAADMRAIGFDGIDENTQFAMAVHDVSLEFAKAMRVENFSDLDTDKLIAFRIFNVNSEFIRELRTQGLAVSSADMLIAFRVHGVSPEFVANIEALGFKRPHPDQLVAMRVHGVTPEFISNLKSRGLKDLSVDQLINLRVHGID
jgi:hypothetical protein